MAKKAKTIAECLELLDTRTEAEVREMANQLADDDGRSKATKQDYRDAGNRLLFDASDALDSVEAQIREKVPGLFREKGLSIRKAEQLEKEATVPKAEAKAAEGSLKVADWVKTQLESRGPDEATTWRELFRKADEAFGGTQAEGAYTVKDAYDAMELGVNQWVLESRGDRYNPQRGGLAGRAIRGLKARIKSLPTQTKRTAEQDEFQQFSTPPPHAYAVSWVANIGPADVVLEPSAGLGGIAVFAKKAAPRAVYVNELSERRARLLETLGFDQVFTENAEQIDNILPDNIKPTVVVMNPPFSATAGRVQGKRSTMVATKHIEQALERLEPGGRLVAIVGEGMRDDAPAFKKWWRETKQKYNVRANIGIEGREYVKYGTTFDNQLLVIDKTGATEYNPVTGKVANVEDLLPLLRGVRDARQAVVERGPGAKPAPGEPAGPRGAEASEGPGREPAIPVRPSVGDVGAGERASDAAVRGSSDKPGEPAVPRPPQARDEASPRSPQPEPGDEGRGDLPGEGPRGVGAPPQQAERDAARLPDAERPAGELQIETIRQQQKGEFTDSLYEGYQPEKLRISGAKAHPTKLVQSAAMAAMERPDPTYQPSLPPAPIEAGKISDIQLEEVVYAGQAHEQTLPSGERRGYFIGDGCVAAGTRIYNPATGEHVPIEALVETGKPHTVLSLTPKGFIPRLACTPFLKGTADLYEVLLEDGRKVTVTDEHRFLTPLGWMRICDGLTEGHFLACAEGPPAYSLGFSPPTPLSGAPHWLRKPQDCLDRYYHEHRPDDERSLSDRDIDPASSPSPAYAHERSRDYPQKDDRGPSQEHSRQRPLSCLRAKRSSSPSANLAPSWSEAQGAEAFARPSEETHPVPRQFPTETAWPRLSVIAIASRQLEPSSDLFQIETEGLCCVFSEDRQPWGESPRIGKQGQLLTFQPNTPPQPRSLACQECSGAVSSCGPRHLDGEDIYSRWNRITSIRFVKKAPYYDMYVPGPQNYVAEGIVHHNTGVGKGREIAGILWDNWNKGRKKAVWVSEKRSLFKDAQRDVQGVGWNPKVLKDVGKIKAASDISDMGPGVLFYTYDTLKGGVQREGGQSRLDQLAAWLGEDFDGVIAFDESHNMANAMDTRGPRGVKAAARKALAGVALQQRFPNARVVYVSATGATEVSNLAYAERLGIWGRGTPFGDKTEFINQIAAGGVANMELVAMNLKAMGAYNARSLSYDGVEYERLEHALTPDQKAEYDDLAEAWQTVLENIEAAIEVTGVAGRERANAIGAFWGNHQRFFNQIITAMQTPAVIKRAKKDIASGHSVVIQLTNTMDASQQRALDKMKADETEDLESLDLSPKQTLIEYLIKSFPTQQFEEVMGQDGNVQMVPVVDSNGNPVENREAVRMRDRLIDMVGSLRMREAPLDMVVNAFGAENVAEVTGRKSRVVEKPDKDGNVRRIEEKRSEAKANADADAFMQGKKRILLFSEKGGTGRSYHSDMDGKNQQKRVHYLLQAGWRADKAVQGLGRTHRSNQAHPPKYILVTTDLKGQKRFISSIARRLDQLGALTKGQRQTGSQGIFDARDNLESSYATTALWNFMQDLANGQTINGITSDVFEKQSGLRLRDAEGRPIFGSITTKQFLNRILNFKVDMQAQAFDGFSMYLDRVIEHHVQQGTLDVGMETLRAEKIEKAREETVYEDPDSNAKAQYVHLKVTNKTPLLEWQAANDYAAGRFYVNLKSKKIWAATVRSETDADTGELKDYYVLKNVTYGTQKLESATISDTKKWRHVADIKEAQSLWEEEINSAPKTITEDRHLLTGTLLPIWDRINEGSPRIMRVQTEDGSRMIGRLVPQRGIDRVLKNLGATAEKAAATAEDVFNNVKMGFAYRLANDWRIVKKRVSGDDRIEVQGLSYRQFANYEPLGMFSERIEYNTRFFIPMTQQGKELVAEILKASPVVDTVAPARLREDQNIFGEEIRFSQASADSPKGVSLHQAQVIVNRIKRHWQNPADEITVVKTAADIQDEAVQRSMSPDMRVKAVFSGTEGRRRIWVVADNLDSTGDVKRAFMEEALGHDGLRQAFGDQLDAFLDGTYKDHADKIAEVADRYRIDTTTEQGRRKATDEWIAQGIADASLPRRVMDRIVRAIRAWARRVFPGLKVSVAEARDLARAAIERGERFGGVAGDVRLAAAWHGTPHILAAEPGFPHGRFRLDKIGEGEGAQSFGWGIYFAEEEATGEHYRRRLTEDSPFRFVIDQYEIAGDRAWMLDITYMDGSTKGRPPHYLGDGELAGYLGPQYAKEIIDRSDAGEMIENAVVEFEPEEIGSLYQLDIPDAVIPKLLDWDKPLSEQSESVKKALQPLVDWWVYREGTADADAMDNMMATMTGDFLYSYSKLWTALDKDGRLNYDGDKSISEYFASIGIPGLKYLDQGSRAEGEGTRNYVIWDQSVLDQIVLLKRNEERLDAMQEADIRFSRESVKPWPADFPKAFSHTTVGRVTKHEDHAAAKAGDFEAARRLVEDTVKRERVRELAKRFPEAILAPVFEQEKAGINVIPHAIAEAYADAGLRIQDDLYQVSAAKRTGLDAAQRLLARKRFEGTVLPGGKYILIDDILTQGGTAHELRHHIANNGGEVVGVVSLAFAAGSNIIAIKDSTVSQLKERFGDEQLRNLLDEFNIAGSVEALTESEGKAILRFKSIDSLRNRLIEAQGTIAPKKDSGAQPLRSVRESLTEDARHALAGRKVDDTVKELDQAISSAATSIRQVPAAFKRVEWEPEAVNLDIGGGRYDDGTNFLADKGVESLVYDPYNRTEAHNQEVFRRLREGLQPDTVTANNVLNVIAERGVRSNLIRQAARVLKENGTAYFTVYEGDKTGVGRKTTKGWQANKKTEAFLEEVKEHFGSVQRKGNLIIAEEPLTRGPAVWSMGEDTADIRFAQEPLDQYDKVDTDPDISPAVRDFIKKYRETTAPKDLPRGEKAQKAKRNVELQEDLAPGDNSLVMDVVEGFKGAITRRGKNWVATKEDLSAFDVTLGLPSHSAEKVPAWGRVYHHALKARDIKEEISQGLIKDPVTGRSTTDYWRSLQKSDKAAYKAAAKELVDNDIAEKGYRVFEADEGMWRVQTKNPVQYISVHTTKAEAQEAQGRLSPRSPGHIYEVREGDRSNEWHLVRRVRGEPIGEFANEEEAWAAARSHEVEGARKKYGDLAADAVRVSRATTDKGFMLLTRQLRDLRRAKEEAGLPPVIETVKMDGSKVEVDLKEALAMMGDMRGHYFPRKRKPGQYLVYSRKKGERPEMKVFDRKVFADAYEARQIKKGYTTEKRKADTLPEDVFEMYRKVVGVQEVLTEALNRIQAEDLRLEDFGLRFIDRKVGARRDFAVFGPSSKAMNAVFKDLGGKFYSPTAGEPRGWHFENPGPHFERRLVRALAAKVDIIDQKMTGLFAEALAENLSNVIKEHGHRAHMIRRRKDVVVGYETDPQLAYAQYASGIASGQAKGRMAMGLARSGTGTDISWGQYQELITLLQDNEGLQNYEEFQQDFFDYQITETEHADLVETAKNTEGRVDYADYQRLVMDRRIDPAKQPNAFKAYKKISETMLRNQESAERVVGFFKGLAVFKYLAFRMFSAPLINLTAMPTSATAAMSGYGDIPLGESMKNIAKGCRAYYRFRRGDTKGMDPDIVSLFTEMRQKGWDNAQFNQEAFSVLQGKVGRGWNKLIEWGMFTFAASEQLNRAATISGAFMALKDQAKKQGKAFNRKEAMALAKKISDNSHGVYDKSNKPMLIMGSGYGPQIGQAYYMYRTFVYTYLLTMRDLGFQLGPIKVGRGNTMPFLWMLASPALLAGAGASAATPLIQALLKAVTDRDDPEEEFYRWLYDEVNPTAERAARFGLFGLAGVNLKGSLRMQLMDIPTKPAEILGAPGSVLTDVYQGLHKMTKGEAWKGFEQIAPLGMAAPFKAIRESTQGLTTRSNAPLFYGPDPVKLEGVDTVLRVLAFNPARIAAIREEQWSDTRGAAKWSERKRDIYARIKKFYLLPAEKRTKKRWGEIVALIEDYNERVIRAGAVKRGLATPINRDSIRQSLRMSFRPSRRERLREGRE